MILLLYFLYGLAFEGLGLAAYLQLRREGDFPLKKELPWLAAFGFVGGAAGWVDMFLTSGSLDEIANILSILRLIVYLLTGLLLLRFGWGVLNNLDTLSAWSIFIPGILIVPIAFVITYAATTFITPSPIEIPIEIWTRYLVSEGSCSITWFNWLDHFGAKMSLSVGRDRLYFANVA